MTSPRTVLVTGASGFVGGALVSRLASDGVTVRAGARHEPSRLPSGVDVVIVGDLERDARWGDAVRGVDAVVHCAARVHVMKESSGDGLDAFRRVNVTGTLRLARQAAEAGVRRFVFLSSVKVNGEGTSEGHPYTADDEPAPADAYGLSKHEAEQGLRALARETGLEVVIIRPVLVYGPGVKGNFAALMRLVSSGMPLPFGAVHNQRSLVAIDNLVHLIARSLNHPSAANETLMVSDGEDMSTAELLRRTATALAVPARLIPVPAALLRAGAAIVGRQDMALRLLGSLQVDIGKTRRLLGWNPPVAVDDALRRTARHFLQEGRARTESPRPSLPF